MLCARPAFKVRAANLTPINPASCRSNQRARALSCGWQSPSEAQGLSGLRCIPTGTAPRLSPGWPRGAARHALPCCHRSSACSPPLTATVTARHRHRCECSGQRGGDRDLPGTQSAPCARPVGIKGRPGGEPGGSRLDLRREKVKSFLERSCYHGAEHFIPLFICPSIYCP